MSSRRPVRRARFLRSLAVVVGVVGSTAALWAPPSADAARLLHQTGFVRLGHRAVFVAYHPTAGQSLWITDGTAGGTRILADGYGDFVTPFAEHDGHLFLLLNPNVRQHPEEGTTLRVTDGTPAGTVELPVPFGAIDSFVALGGVSPGGPLLFVAPGEPGEIAVWASDGTVAGTRVLVPLGPGVIAPPVRLGDRFVFAVHRFEPPSAVLWSIGATGEGAVGTEVAAEWLGGFAAFDGEVLAMASTDAIELWALAADGSAPRPAARLGDRDLVSPGVGVFALDGGAFLTVREVATGGDRVWLSDGTLAGTTPVDLPLAGVAASLLDVVAGRLWFVRSRLDYEIWTSDGTRAGTRPVAELTPLADSRGTTFQELDEGVVFRARSGSAFLPWFSDGTAEGTAQLGEVCAPPCHAVAGALEVWDGAVYATVGAEAGPAVWRFDRGHPPRRLTDQAVRPRWELGVAGDRLVFLSDDGVLWSSDGTPTGTAPVIDLDLVPPDLSPCVPGAETLCLGEGRFTVQVRLSVGYEFPFAHPRRFDGSDRSGWFWSFAPDNPEIVVKILDGTPINGRWWVFVGALTGLPGEVRVRDAASGLTRVYRRPADSTEGVIDLDAFPAVYDPAFPR